MKDRYYDTFAGLLGDIDQSLRQFIQQMPRTTPLFWEMVEHHFGWLDDSSARDRGGINLSGKRIRPLLVVLVARALTGRHDHALPAATAVEIIHNFTLVHDDVMDKSEERRHRETLWSKWGAAQAINAGDGLYALGMSALLGLQGAGEMAPSKVLDAMRFLLDACLATVEGQMLDVSFEQQIDVTPDTYLTMISGKSAALIECSTRMGALLSTDDPTVIEAYGRFGRSLGIAFQIWDDYLGIWGRAEAMGKSATSDIETKKKSYPVLVAFQQADAVTRANLLSIYHKELLDARDVSCVLDILRAVRAEEQTRDLIDVHFRAALAALDAVGVDNDDQRHLRELASFLIERAY